MKALLGLITFLPAIAFAQVEIEKESYHGQPYVERRESSGLLVSLSYEPHNFDDYLSTLDSLAYSEAYSGATNIFGLTVSFKKNWSPVSVALGLGYGVGSVSGSQEREMEISKMRLSSRWSLDGLWPEPHFVPFALLEMWKLQISESGVGSSFSGETGYGIQYGLGVAVQMNRLDPSTSAQAFSDWGMQNAFIDVYIFATTKPLFDGPDPEVATSPAVAAALTLEF